MKLIAVIGCVALVGVSVAAQRGDRQRSEPADRSAFTSPQDARYPLNVDPELLPAAAAAIEDSDLVMGIVINGEARAYPVNYMNGPTNEVLNDTLGGTPIAPSW